MPTIAYRPSIILLHILERLITTLSVRNYIPYSAKFWRGKTLANLANCTSFANILPSQIPDSLK